MIQSTCKRKDEFSLPDLYFFKWCDKQYGINRGVYNALDALLYQKGFTDVYSRRAVLTEFLTYSLSVEIFDKKLKVIQFGKGNLKRKLNGFLSKTI